MGGMGVIVSPYASGLLLMLSVSEELVLLEIIRR
jgi:hypothetical protein